MKLEQQVFGKDRHADIGTVNGRYNVVLYEKGQQVRIVEVHEHNRMYALDVAENWVTGLIKQ
jgi:hypothetical protein